MPLTSSSKENIALKKLVGKAHTSNTLEAFNENKPTSITLSTSTIFSDSIPENPSSSSLYEVTNNTVEYVRLVATKIQESQVSGKFHAFKLSLPEAYYDSTDPAKQESNNTSKRGTSVFISNQDLYSSMGKLQLVPESFSNSYQVKSYYNGNTSLNNGTRIPLLDQSNWYLDYFNGILYQQDPQFSDTSINVTDTPLTPGLSYKINNVGNTDNTKWESLGLSQSVTPESGVCFVASSSQPADINFYGSGSVYEERNPSHVEAFIYIGNMANTDISSNDLSSSSIGDLSDVDITSAAPSADQILKWDGSKFIPSDDTGGTSFSADTASMWKLSDDGTELSPHGIIDGTLDTGMFAINLSGGSIDYSNPNVTLHNILEELSSINAYTPSTRSQQSINDTYWEFDNDGNITTK